MPCGQGDSRVMACGQGEGAAHNSYSAASIIISGEAAKYILRGASKSCAPHHPLGRSPFPLSHLAVRRYPSATLPMTVLIGVNIQPLNSSTNRNSLRYAKRRLSASFCNFFYRVRALSKCSFKIRMERWSSSISASVRWSSMISSTPSLPTLTGTEAKLSWMP